MDIFIPRYANPGRPGGIIPPSPPAEYRQARRAGLVKALRTHKGTLPPLSVPGYDERPRLILPGVPGYQETLWRILTMPAGSATVMGGAPPNPLASLTDASLYFKLEESSGNRLDATANANDMTPTGGPGGAAGKIGNCLTVAAGQYVSHAYSSAWDMSSFNWTISCWLYITSKADFRTAWNVGGSGHVQAALQYQKAGFGDVMQFGWEDDAQVGRAITNTNFGSPTLNTWLFYVCYGSTTGGTAGGPRTGMRCNNGTANEDTTHKSFYNRSTGLYIGAQFQSSAGFSWVGNIDELGGWKRFLSQADNDLLWNSGNGASPF